MPVPPPDRAYSALRAPTGLVLTALGSILLLAVHIRLGFIKAQPAGLVLLVTGLAWLWLPVRGKRTLVKRMSDRVVAFLEWDGTGTAEAQCSLAELLQSRAVQPDDARAATIEPASVAQHDG